MGSAEPILLGSPLSLLSFSFSEPSEGDVGSAYNQTLTAGGGVGNKTLKYQVTFGSIPAGLAFTTSPNQLVISGTPAAAGTVSYSVTATYQDGNTDTQSYTLTINPALTLSPAISPAATAGAPYIEVLSANGGYNPKPLIYHVTSGSLPAGLSIGPLTSINSLQELQQLGSFSFGGLLISGTPTASGSVTFSVAATDRAGGSATQSYTLTVNPAGSIALSPSTLPAGTVDGSYNQTITASGGGTTTLSYTVTSGAIPSGFSFTPGTNELTIAGTPTAAGTVAFSVTAKDLAGKTATQSYTLSVNPNGPISLGPSSLPDGYVGTSYNRAITASGGSGDKTLTYSVSSGSLPAGLLINSAEDELTITGTPITNGSVTLSVSAKDRAGDTQTHSYTLTVNAASVIAFSSSTLPDATSGVAYNQSITVSGGSGTLTLTDNVPSKTLGLKFSIHGSSLTIAGTPTAAGSIPSSVTVTGPAGDNATLNYTLLVNAVAITTHPVNQSAVAGQSATFTAAASGILPLAVQWQVSSDGGKTFSNISGAISTTLTLSNVTTAMNGYEYQAVFTNSAGSTTSSAATLTVQSVPKVTASPSNPTLTAGQTAIFTAAASGSPTPTVQWQVSSDGGKTFTNLSGATSTTLTLSNVTTAMSGSEYEAAFTNSVGTVTSGTATLTVQYAPNVTTSPANQTVTAGQIATFTAAANGNPSPSLQWQVSTDDGKTLTRISGATSPTLTLTAVTTAMSGDEYQAVFTNRIGSTTTSAATLTVQSAPSVTASPSNQTVTAGQTAIFTAAAGGSPTPTVQWQVSNDGGKTFTNLSGATGTTLTLSNVTTAMSGNEYEAIFTNSAGSVTTGAATLTVNALPPPPPPPPSLSPHSSTPPWSPPAPPAPPQAPPLLATLNQFLGGTLTVNANGTEMITDSVFGIPLLVSMFSPSGDLVSVDLFGIDITFLFV